MSYIISTSLSLCLPPWHCCLNRPCSSSCVSSPSCRRILQVLVLVGKDQNGDLNQQAWASRFLERSFSRSGKVWWPRAVANFTLLTLSLLVNLVRISVFFLIFPQRSQHFFSNLVGGHKNTAIAGKGAQKGHKSKEWP